MDRAFIVAAQQGWQVVTLRSEGGLELHREPVIAWEIDVCSKGAPKPVTAVGSRRPPGVLLQRPDGSFLAPDGKEVNSSDEARDFLS
jgi:hypothetical protein